MTDHQPNCARQSENVHDANQQDGSSGPPVDASEPKAITNIYYDCLERIFDFLDLESLVNVADTCKRLRTAAATKFGDDFGEKIIRLDECNTSINGDYIRSWTDSHITVIGFKSCLSLLRCFGAKIKHLEICHLSHWALDDSWHEHINEYINEFCADSLISIEFENRDPKFWISNPSKPFKNVEKIVASRYFDKPPHFLNWFPKLRHLKLQLNIDDFCRFAHPFPCPSLEHLELSGYVYENILGFLPANPQLKSVSIDSPRRKVSTKHLLNVLATNASLMKLELRLANTSRCTPVNEDDIVQFAKQHPLLAELWLFEIKADQAVMFIRHLTSLKRFKFTLTDHPEYHRLLNQLDSKWKHSTEEFQIELTC